MKKNYKPSKQFTIRLMVYLNFHTIKHGTTYCLYAGEKPLSRIRMAKRVCRIRRGTTDIEKFMFN